MRIFYLSKQSGRALAAYLAALVLMIAGAGLFLPGGETPAAPVVSESAGSPYRSGSEDISNISLAINVDWGEEYIPDMLAVLEEYDVSATFFLTGRWCANNAELAKQISAAGHELGNHGYSHSSPNASSIDEIVEEITRTEEAIRNATGVTTDLYAPPSGEAEDHVVTAAESAGYDTILWSVDTIDWQKPDAATIIDRVTGKVENGSIILAHPTANTLEALPMLIEQLQAEGYQLVTVSENLGL